MKNVIEYKETNKIEIKVRIKSLKEVYLNIYFITFALIYTS